MRLTAPLDLRYDEFVLWHETARRTYLEPARTTALRLIEELLESRVEPLDRGRFRVTSSRVKTTQRLFAKASIDKYNKQIDSYESIPSVIDDLVGVRLVCNNLSDINLLQEILGELPLDGTSDDGLTIQKGSHRDYFSNPKPSGYRAYHANFVVPVPQMSGTVRVRVELQARTLLQDGWGELTHEDSYKPGSSVPEWIVAMSLRMAELLAAVDNIAQDLRTGLDVETQRSVTSLADADGLNVALITDGSADVLIPTRTEESTSPQDFAAEQERQRWARGERTEIESALAQETVRLVTSLRRPTALAVVAQDLNLIFGTDITKTWADFGGFKKFLQMAVPTVLLTGPAPGYVHPLGASIPDAWTLEDTGVDTVPALVRELRTYDKALPLIGSERLNDVLECVVGVLAGSDPRDEGGNATVSQLDALARKARSQGESQERLVVRPHALYVLQALNRVNQVKGDLDVATVKFILFERIMELAEANGLISDHQAAVRDISEWLSIEAV